MMSTEPDDDTVVRDADGEVYVYPPEPAPDLDVFVIDAGGYRWVRSRWGGDDDPRWYWQPYHGTAELAWGGPLRPRVYVPQARLAVVEAELVEARAKLRAVEELPSLWEAALVKGNSDGYVLALKVAARGIRESLATPTTGASGD
jgi:hypothetical protein